MSKIVDVNKLYATREISETFDKLKYRMERGRAYRKNGILREGTTHRWALNINDEGRRYTLMFLTDQRINPKEAEKFLRDSAKNITPREIEKYSRRPTDTGIKLGD